MDAYKRLAVLWTILLCRPLRLCGLGWTRLDWNGVGLAMLGYAGFNGLASDGLDGPNELKWAGLRWITPDGRRYHAMPNQTGMGYTIPYHTSTDCHCPASCYRPLPTSLRSCYRLMSGGGCIWWVVGGLVEDRYTGGRVGASRQPNDSV